MMFKMEKPLISLSGKDLPLDSLEKYAVSIIRDFAPQSLQTPNIFDATEFLESYLGLRVAYRHILDDKSILGITALTDSTIQVIDQFSGKVENMPVKAGTVVIDQSLTRMNEFSRLRYTLLHESAHWLLYQDDFSDGWLPGHFGVRETEGMRMSSWGYDCFCRHNTTNVGEDNEFLADYLANAILMPKPALRGVYRDFCALMGIKPRRFVRSLGNNDYYFSLALTNHIADKFKVPEEAAQFRLEQLNAVVDDVPQNAFYSFVVQGSAPELWSNVALRVDKNRYRDRLRDIRCPYCGKPLVSVPLTTKVDLRCYPFRSTYSCHQLKTCDSCHRKIGIVFVS